MLQGVLDFLSAYYPHYLCPPCLANLIFEQEEIVRAWLASTPGLELRIALCICCNGKTHGVRFRNG
jgi:hypothetical protein